MPGQRLLHALTRLIVFFIIMLGAFAPAHGAQRTSHMAESVEAASTLPPLRSQKMLPAPEHASQPTDPVVYRRYDVQIDLRPDGTFHVREEQEILFNESFRTAFAEIPLDYVSEIDDIEISTADGPYSLVGAQASAPGTYSVSYEGQAVFVDWAYAETAPGETRTFALDYDVSGGLWLYEDGDILEWRAVPADRSDVPVLSSTVTVTLPQAIALSDVQANAFGPAYRVDVSEQQVVFSSEEEIPDGTAFQVMVGFPHGLVQASVQPWQRQEDSADLVYSIPAVDVELDIDADGVVRVTERQTVSVYEGILYAGQRTIPLAYVDGLLNYTVSEGQDLFALYNEPNTTCESCAWVQERRGSGDWIRLNRGMGTIVLDEESAGSVQVGWTAPPLVKGEETTFVLHYTALGALQISDAAQVLSWTPVSGLDVAVDAVRVFISLPPGVMAQDVAVEGGTLSTASDGRLMITREGRLAAGEGWSIRLTLPAQATSAPKPAWQQEMEAVVLEADAIRESIRQEEIRRARLQLAFGVGGALLLVGGLLAAVLFWYLWGRDETTLPVPLYLSEPPSDLPPGIVAYLLDEKPTPKGVLASLFHLATLGLLQIRLSEPLALARNYEEALVEGQMIEKANGEMVTIPSHMVHLFNGLRQHLGTALAPLAQITSHLPAIIPQVYLEMGEEATQFFDQLPGEKRHRWLVYGQWVVLGGLGLALAAAFFYVSSLGWIAIVPAVALIISGATLILISRWMPRRSDAGALEAARWRAFEHYLRELKTYGDQDDAQRILEEHFAYAVALDVEDVVLSQAAQLEAIMPSWTRPIILRGPALPGPEAHMPPASRTRLPLPGLLRRDATVQRDLAQGKGEGVPGQMPSERRSLSLEGLAASLASRLNRANDSLTQSLSRAVGDVSETPFQLVWRGARGAGKITWKATTTSLEIMETILNEASSGGGSSSFRGSSGRSSRSSWGSSRSSSFSSRSSSSRRSGGGGRRGFGR